MSGILQEVMVGDGPNTYVEYSGTLNVGYGVGVSPVSYQYGYNVTGPVGSISDTSGGTGKALIAFSYSADFSNPQTTIWFDPTTPGSWDTVTSFAVTIDGVSRSDGAKTSSTFYTWSGDPFLIRSKNGQSLAVKIVGTA